MGRDDCCLAISIKKNPCADVHGKENNNTEEEQGEVQMLGGPCSWCDNRVSYQTDTTAALLGCLRGSVAVCVSPFCRREAEIADGLHCLSAHQWEEAHTPGLLLTPMHTQTHHN